MHRDAEESGGGLVLREWVSPAFEQPFEMSEPIHQDIDPPVEEPELSIEPCQHADTRTKDRDDENADLNPVRRRHLDFEVDRRLIVAALSGVAVGRLADRCGRVVRFEAVVALVIGHQLLSHAESLSQRSRRTCPLYSIILRTTHTAGLLTESASAFRTSEQVARSVPTAHTLSGTMSILLLKTPCTRSAVSVLATYSNVTEACLVIGVTSEIGFDTTGNNGWLVTGAIAAIVAIGAYFRRHWKTNANTKLEH